MRYIARTPLKYRDAANKERKIGIGRSVPDELVDSSLIDCGAIEAADEEEVEDRPIKALAKMTRAELDVVVAAEVVDIGESNTNADIIRAIEAKRAGGQG